MAWVVECYERGERWVPREIRAYQIDAEDVLRAYEQNYRDGSFRLREYVPTDA
jgi:hypothetical protein